MKLGRRFRGRSWRLAVVAAAVALASTTTASADEPAAQSSPDPDPPLVTCAPATGHVWDNFGLPLAGITVSWTANANSHKCPGTPVQTDADGLYSIPLEVTTTPSRVRVHSTRTVDQYRLMLPDALEPTADHEFDVLYRTTDAAASPAYARSGATVTATARTPAPDWPTSKVIAEWPGTAAPVVMDLVSTADGWKTWRSVRTLSATEAEGDHWVRMCGVTEWHAGTCAAADVGGALISSTASARYTVDNSAPDTVAGRIVPLSGGNVQTGLSTPLSVKISDPGGAGVALGGVTFRLTDHTAGTTTTHAAVGQNGTEYNSSPVAFAAGHLYRAEVTARDRAGNETTVAQAPLAEGGGFLAVSLPNLATTARSAASAASQPCSVGAVETAGTPPTAFRRVTCSNVQIRFPGVPLDLSGTRHGGTGNLVQSLLLNNLKIHPTLAGSSVGQSDVTPLATRTETVEQRFWVGGPREAAFTVNTDEVVVTIPEITAAVSASADGATIDMPATAASAKTMACPLPGNSTPWCSPDPIPAVVNTGGLRVEDVVTLPGGLVLADLKRAGVVGPVGIAVGHTRAGVHDTPTTGIVTDEFSALPPGESTDDLLPWDWFYAAGWSKQGIAEVVTRNQLGESLNSIARQR